MSNQVLQTIAGGSRGVGYIYGGRVVAGFGIGAISAVAPAYVSECSPKEVRGRITGCFQIMVSLHTIILFPRSSNCKVALGVMFSYFVNCMSSRISTPLYCADCMQTECLHIFTLARKSGESHLVSSSFRQV